MSADEKRQTAAFHNGYARRFDFCELFEKEMRSFYLLAFLLTANHKEAEQCFGLALQDALKEQAVFKEWAQAWVKRSLIKHAIRIVSPRSPQSGHRDLWNASLECIAVDVVTKLAPLERFVFVMSVLESLSVRDSALLLDFSLSEVSQARVRALRHLPGVEAMFAGMGSQPAHLLEVPA